MRKIYLFSHNYLINNWKEILENQLNLLISSKLYDQMTNMYLMAYGDDQWNDLIKLIRVYDIDNKIITLNIDENFYEYPTLQKLYKFIKKIDENSYIFYFHLKGVWSSKDTNRNKKAIKSWRKCLEYFNIEKWNDCITKLDEGYEVVGALYNYNETEPLFSGNFWWTTSNYIKKLKYPEYDSSKDPWFGKPEDDGGWCRVECEKWINTIPNNFFNFFVPKDYGFYYVPIEEKDYRIDIKHEHIYENIDGWFDFQEVYTEMINRFSDGSHFVEIGAWLGKSTSYMAVEIANSQKNIKFDVIDTWMGSKNFVDENFYKTERNPFDIFMDNISSIKQFINPIQGKSNDIVKNYNDESLDFVFIDAGHDYESVITDIKNWYPKVKNNGIIAGHDYIGYTDVKKAVDEFFGENNIRLHLVHAGTWIIEKNQFEVLKKYRIFFIHDDCNGVNRLFGLRDLIKDVVNKDSIICEIGSFGGVSSELFALNCKELYCIDLWDDFWTPDGYQKDVNIPVAEKDFDNMMKKYNHIKKIKKFSVEASKDFSDEFFDVVYIDATHDYESTKNDIINWLPKVKKNGFLCGHGYYLNQEIIDPREDVKRVIDELFPNYNVKSYSDSSWCIKMEDYYKLNNIMNKLRMFHGDDAGGVNRLFGLKRLIDENITRNMIMCEVGSFAGTSSELFSMFCKEIHCVDSWISYNELPSDELINEAEKRFDDVKSQNNNIIKIKMTSESASKIYSNNYFDCVYIDAMHDYESAKKDILLWIPKIKANGIICGHDYHSDCAVKKVVDEIFQNISIKVYPDSSWCIKMEDYHKEKYKISIIIPTYNRENALIECINSVINQNYNNIEILVCHDGPWKKEFNYNDNRIRIYNTDKQYNNLGASQRNMMIPEITGDCVLFLDDDNILYDNYLNKMIKQIDEKTGMVVCRIHFNDKEWNNLILPPTDELIPAKIDHLSILFITDITNKFIWDNDWGQDHRYINNCEKLCNELGLKIKFIPDVLANHRFINRVDELLKERRLEQYQWDDNGVNRLFGLKDMIDENLNKETIVCEIGSFEGKSSEMFALLTKQVYCVDPWVLYPQIDNESMIKSESIFDLLLTKYDNIVKIKNFSIEASKLFNDKFFDCVYIDGDHDYEPVKQDILHWMPKVKDGGHISGHDYHFEGVRKALDELFVGIELKVYSDQSWIVKIDDYRKEKKPVIIMTAHPNFKTSEDITKQALESLKPLNIDTILCTHCPTLPHIQKAATHFLFDKNNPLIRHDYYEQSWFDKEDYYSLIKLHKNDNDLQHALAVYINYYNGILHAKSLGYKTAICTNFDIVFHEDDLDIIKCKINEMKLNNKKSFYMTSNANEGIHYKTIFFITDIDFFIENFKYVTNEDDYNSLTREVGSNTNCLENVFYQTLKSKSDQLLLQQIEEKDLFSVSKVNLFSNIEYFTILPLKNDNEHFVIWFSSSNSFDDNRDLTIKVFKDFEGSYLKNDVITKNYIFFHKVKFEKNHTYNISCEITYNGDIKKKNIIINNESFDKLKENGEFWDKKGILE